MVVKRFLLLSLIMTMTAVGAAQWDPLTKIKADFYTWNMVLETMAVDYTAFPKGDDIQAVGAFLKGFYWDEPILYDPWGNPYRYSSDGKTYTLTSPGPDGKLSTADDLTSRGVFVAPMPPPEEKSSKPAGLSYSIPVPRSTGSSLMLSKSGTDDVLFTWSGAGPTYDVTGATDPRFLNSYLLQNDIAGSPYTYTGALKNPKSVEFFDVTEPTETNHAQDANGLYPATPPSLSTATGNWFIGGSVNVTGAAFSEVYKDNVVCFPGGYCIHPDDTSTTTQLDFKVPPGAITGSIVNSLGILESNKLSATISLEDPALSALTIRTIGFAKTAGHYYTCDLDAGVQKAYRHSYDPATGKWVRYPVTFFIAPPHFYYGSTKMDQFKHLFFVDAYPAISLSESTRVVTDPPSDAMVSCKALGVPGSGRTVKGAGAAPDPNPENIAGRDVVYFAFDDGGVGSKYIYKIAVNAGGCGNILDTDYGNRGGAWYWNAIVGMSVDPKTGDLYVAERLTTTTAVVKVIRNDGSETLQTVATGFTNVFGVDVWREPGGDFGFILATDFVTGQLKSIPIDNTAAGASVLTSGSSMRAVTTGLTTYDTSTYQASDLIRLLVAHNDGSTIKLRKPPYFSTDPYESMPVNIWISSPEPSDKPMYQGIVRPSYGGGTTYSTVKMKAWFTDGVARSICAASGDPLSTAAHTFVPSPVPAACNKWWKDPVDGTEYAFCDNSVQFTTGQTGSSTGNNDFVDCHTGCGTLSNPCVFDFRISSSYSEENYRYFFMLPQSRTVLSSFMSNAFKRGLIEQDQMCERGGMLYEDSAIGQTQIKVAKNLDGTRADNLQLGDTIYIFDTQNPYSPSSDCACVRELDTVPAQYVLVTLGQVGSCSTTLEPLDRNYDASPWDFSAGKSAGVCVDGSGFYTANSSPANRRDKTGPFDDAFVQFYASTAGGGVVPYWSTVSLSPLQDRASSMRHHQLWFSNSRPAGCFLDPPANTVWCDTCCNNANNYFHLMGVNQREIGAWGASIAGSDITWSYIGFIRTDCPSCSAAELLNAYGHNFCHECGHHYGVNCGLEGHDDNGVWCTMCGGTITQTCAMSILQSLQDRKDGIDRFCCFNLTENPTFCSGDATKCGEGIRKTNDPN